MIIILFYIKSKFSLHKNLSGMRVTFAKKVTAQTILQHKVLLHYICRINSMCYERNVLYKNNRLILEDVIRDIESDELHQRDT